MTEVLTKYNALSKEMQKEVDNFLDFLLSKLQGKQSFDIEKWKEKIKDISVWPEEEENHSSKFIQ